MLKFTHSRGHINHGLAIGGLLAAVLPIVAVAATGGGFAAVGAPMWITLGGAVSALFAGNVELKTPVERVLEAEARKAGGDDGG